MLTRSQVESALNADEVIVCIGQLSTEHKLALDLMARRGQIQKWRGKWFPVAGAPMGLGPDKACYGTAAAKQACLASVAA